MTTSTDQMIRHFEESNTFEKILIDNADEALYFYSMEGKLIYVNPAFEKITGFKSQELYKNNFIPFVHPDDQEWTMKLWEGLYRGELFEDIEYRIIKNNGDIRWSLSSWKVVLDQCGNQIGIQGKQQDITKRKLAEEELKISHDTNKQLASKLADINTALQEEIVEKKNSELQSVRLQDELIHLGRLSTMGDMAAGLAHELNQPLLAVVHSADSALLAVKDNPEDPLLIQCLEDIQSYIHKAAEIIRSLRQFIGRNTMKKGRISVNELVHQAVHLVKNDARTLNIEIKIVEGDIQEPLADRVRIAQVLVNLLRNSIDAISSVEEVEKSQNLIIINTSEFANEVVVSVTDTGPGFESGIEPFKAFETSKIDGLGLGLSISRTIIESHGGLCSLDSNLTSGGCRIVFTLPLGA